MGEPNVYTKYIYLPGFETKGKTNQRQLQLPQVAKNPTEALTNSAHCWVMFRIRGKPPSPETGIHHQK